MRVGSLFSGIGGIELGLERAGGFETTWFVECEPFCQAVLQEHWPKAQVYGDITKIDWTTVEPIDILTGGFPCQPHSLTGKRKASEDERDLWPEFVRAIRHLKPKWIVAENVKGLLSSEEGRFFGRVLSDLADLGYHAEWQVIPAASVGASHLRERVVLVSYTDEIRLQGRKHDWTFFRPQTLPQTQVRWELSSPHVCRTIDGIPDRTHRLKCLGNAVVPAVAEVIAQRIKEVS